MQPRTPADTPGPAALARGVMCLAASVALTALAACGGSAPSLSDGSRCTDWNKASDSSRQDYAGQVYESVRRFQTRLNVQRYIVFGNITSYCQRHLEARLGDVKSACTRYLSNCEPLPQPSFLTGSAARSDSDVRGNVDVVAGAIEACYLAEAAKDYAACRRLPGASVPPLGRGIGQVEISVASRGGYTLVGHSPSGVGFTLVKRGGGIGGDARTTRTCSPASRGECPANGRWTGG